MPEARVDEAVSRDDRARRTRVALVVTVGLLALWNLLVRPRLPGTYHVMGGVLVAGAVGGTGAWARLASAEVGLSRSRLRSGLAWGGAAVVLVVGFVLLALAMPPTRQAFHSSQGEVGGPELARHLFVTIPLETVVLEELAFRGVLLGLLLRLTSQARAVGASSALFGLWHLYPVLAGPDGPMLDALGTATGTFVGTAAAGVVFCWLRLRSGSLLAPALAHLATNSVGLLAAWAVSH